MAELHTTIVGGVGWLRPGRYVINHRLPEAGTHPGPVKRRSLVVYY
jgi:hypothetical protein